MIFDYDLMFIDDKDGTQKDVSAGTLGTYIDLSGNGQGKGHRGLIAIAFTSDTTATADPDVSFSLETSETCDFAEIVEIPLSLPTPLKKADLTEGKVLSSPLPLNELKRFIRLKANLESPITCMGIRAGFVFDAPLA